MEIKKKNEQSGEPSEDKIPEASPIIKRNRPWIKWIVLAACLVSVAIIFIKVFSTKPIEPAPEPEDLPMLTVPEDSGEGMGFEGYMVYDIAEIVNDNPWTETMGISTLPVYKNLLSYDENYHILGADFDKMKELLLNVADRLAMGVDPLDIADDTPDNNTKAAITEKFAQTGQTVPENYFSPTFVMIEEKGIKIEVDQHLTAKITFEPTITLPDEYNFTHYASHDQVTAVAEYLKAAYENLIEMGNPQINIYGGDYATFSEEDSEIYGGQQAQSYSIEFYDAIGDHANQIVNYNFHRVAFYCNDDGKLFLARVFQPDLSEKIGDYPIITVNEAKALLENGNYITSVPEELPGLEYEAKVELVYRTGGMEQYFMPYYRFYIELPDMEKEDGLKTYGAYYVPAVEGAYISNMPLWDGSFN